jgi:hypothetical protein
MNRWFSANALHPSVVELRFSGLMFGLSAESRCAGLARDFGAGLATGQNTSDRQCKAGALNITRQPVRRQISLTSPANVQGRAELPFCRK